MVVRGVAKAVVTLGRVTRFAALGLLDWSDRLVYLGFFALEALLLARVFLKVMGADASKPLPQTAYAVSSPIAAAFASAAHLHSLAVGPYVLEPATLVALISATFAAWLLVAVLNLIKRVI